METKQLIGVQEWIDQLIYNYRSEIQNHGKVSAGDLLNNVRGMVVMNDNTYSIQLDLPEHWKNVEDGRKPGTFPNIDAIKRWIKVSQILPRPLANGQLPTENQLAFLIGRKIKRDGIPAAPCLANAIQKTDISKLADIVTEAFAKEIQIITKELNN